MKKLIGIVLSVIVFVAVILIVLKFFRFNISRAGSNDELRSVKESKKYGVFVSEYYSPDGYISYLDNQKLYINEIWIVHNWIYDYWSMPSIVKKGVYGLYISFKEPVDLNIANQDYSYQWKRGECHFNIEARDSRGPLNQFSIWSKGYKNDDTLKIYITKYYPESRKDDTVSSFILIKKK